jgi:hypothetical protein
MKALRKVLRSNRSLGRRGCLALLVLLSSTSRPWPPSPTRPLWSGLDVFANLDEKPRTVGVHVSIRFRIA